MAHASSRHVHKLQIVVVVVAVVIILGHTFMIALMCRHCRLITYATQVPSVGSRAEVYKSTKPAKEISNNNCLKI